VTIQQSGLRLKKKTRCNPTQNTAKIGCKRLYLVVIQNHPKQETTMAIALKLSDELVEDAKTTAAAEHRSVPKQIEYWARIGKTVLENPDMPLRLIQDTMLALEEAKAGKAEPYELG
jgi:hypothetical protein